MAGLPSGTVTFLFTDIEGSTQLLQRLGDGYAAVLDQHRQLLRQAFALHSGHEVDSQGDAFFVAFERAGDAVAAAVTAQQALHQHPWPADAAGAGAHGLAHRRAAAQRQWLRGAGGASWCTGGGRRAWRAGAAVTLNA